ncbi:MAG: hypothetical protein JHC93_07950 [Parachlamydiales bacterium]|nr:hypothetical protein [Parachlamydiales bacterium]
MTYLDSVNNTSNDHYQSNRPYKSNDLEPSNFQNRTVEDLNKAIADTNKHFFEETAKITTAIKVTIAISIIIGVGLLVGSGIGIALLAGSMPIVATGIGILGIPYGLTFLGGGLGLLISYKVGKKVFTKN